MHVSVGADRRYIPHAATALASVLEHGHDVHAHFLHAGELRPDEADALHRMVEQRGGTLSVHDVDPARIEGLPVFGENPVTMWLRTFLPELVPDVSRMLYLDGDTLVVDDLAPLWQTDIEDHYVAAVTNVWEPWNEPYATEKLGIPRYFNSGVLLMNLDLMRRDDSPRALLEVARSQEMPWGDQDALNIVLGERRVELHPRWNAMNSVLTFPEAFEVFGREQVEEARARPGIRHFEGPSVNKPWHLLCAQPGRDEYLRHRAATPWPKVRKEGVTPANLARLAWRRLSA